MSNEVYYVQRLARQSYNQMFPIPDNIQFSKEILQGLSNTEFITALRLLQKIFLKIYTDIFNNPYSYGMYCYKIEYSKTKTYPETKSRKSFFNISNLFLTFAKVGTITNDNGLNINVNTFKLCEKISNQKVVFQHLKEIGFIFKGLPEDCSLLKANDFTVCFPENPNILKAIKAFRNVGLSWRMIAVDYRHLLNNNGFHEEYDIYDAERMLLNGSDKKVLLNVHNRLKALNFKIKLKYAGYFCSIKYFYKKESKETVMIQIEDDDRFYVNIRPLNIVKYAAQLSNLSSHIRTCCINGVDCIRCGYCNKWYVFEYEGKKYEKCQFICANFKLNNFNKEDVESVNKLLEYELSHKISV